MQPDSTKPSFIIRMLRAIWRRFRVATIGFGATLILTVFGGGLSVDSVVGLLIFALLVQAVVWIGRKTTGRKAPVAAVPAQMVPPVVPTRVPAAKAVPARKAVSQVVVPPPPQPKQPKDSARWVRAGESVVVHGVSLPGGMLYVGTHLKRANGWGEEPSLINPTLPVNLKTADTDGRGLDYSPSYAEISPETRAGYLRWLASGRRKVDVPIGFVFLFFYGLERRVLLDISRDASLNGELPGIRAEVAALLAIHGHKSGSVRGYLGSFVDLVDAYATLRQSEPGPAPTNLVGAGWDVPYQIRIGLARFAAQKQPVPWDWALAWVRSNPEMPLRTPAIRCADQFDRLFAIRYATGFGEGIRFPQRAKALSLSYRPASAGIPSVDISVPGLKDVSQAETTVKRLRDFASSVSDELDPYSRLIGRQPDAADSMAAVALLPDDLVGVNQPLVAKVTTWAKAHLGEASMATVSMQELLVAVGLSADEKLARADAVRMGQFLERCGLAMEPDVRFGGAKVMAEESVVIFRHQAASAQTASPEYDAATLLLHLAVAVSAADGDVSGSELESMTRHIEQALRLEPGERVRLKAHLAWLATRAVKLTGLQKRVAGLSEEDRRQIAAVAVALASADGVVSPSEVQVLQRIYGVLGLPTSDVTSDVHQVIVGSRRSAGRDPVVVRAAVGDDLGQAVPERPRAPSSFVVLDPSLLEATLRDSRRAAELLGDIFAEEEVVVDMPPVVRDEPIALSADTVLPGLDLPHSQLVRVLAQHDTLSSEDYAQMADSFGVMPSGALDVINEAALDAVGDYVVELDSDGNLVMVRDLVQEFVA